MLWKQPSFFRGFNLAQDIPITQKDLLDLKKIGATLAYLSTEGFRDPTPPYAEDSANIQVLDERVQYCDSARIYYTIAVRQGPGRNDVYLEGDGQAPPSTIWKNPKEQELYGSMLRAITARYAQDTLCVGITPTVEPNPFFDSLCCVDSASFATFFARNGVNFTAITELWVDSIRAASRTIPILIQGPGYSNPIVYSTVPIINDPNIVYEFHDYHPTQYVKAAQNAAVSYPGAYLDMVNDVPEVPTFNKRFIEDTLFDYISAVQAETHAPIFMGEFGLEYPHTGGTQFLSDMASIAIDKGWHFAYWDWRRPSGWGGWDYEHWDPSYMAAIDESFIEQNESVAESLAPAATLSFTQEVPGSIRVDWSGLEPPGSTVSVQLFDMIGRLERTFTANSHNVLLPTSGLAAGPYLIVLRSGAAQATAFLSISR